MRERLLMRLINIYPPYLGAGVTVRGGLDDPYTIRVRMGLHFWNKNLFGTQFGGSLYHVRSLLRVPWVRKRTAASG